MMELVINGKREQTEDARTLVQVLVRLAVEMDQGGIAVAVNDKVIPKSQWSEHPMNDGDRIEVIHAVQGG